MIISIEWETVERHSETVDLPDGMQTGEITSEAVRHARLWDRAEDSVSRDIIHVSWDAVDEKPGRSGSRRAGDGGL